MVNETNHEAKHTLAEFGINRYSQNGEDGIIEKIFDLIGTASRISSSLVLGTDATCKIRRICGQRVGGPS